MTFFNKSCIPMAIVIPSRESRLHGVAFNMVTLGKTSFAQVCRGPQLDYKVTETAPTTGLSAGCTTML